ncbi:MAG TPA: CHAD domain-containing protein [Streptosporangiaceae bacterium]|nr:CHAD domain-containing protein [Streptosporangiaceae bacterium]
MTPGLREFVLDGGGGADAGTDGASAAGLAPRVRDALAQAFTLAADRGAAGTRRRTWLDTADWRLSRAGLVLQHERARGPGRLLLAGDDGAVLAEQPLTGRQPRWPRLAGDLPDGPVKDRVLPLASPRALLPVATAVSRVTVTRLLNADGKTVARLIADAAAVTRDAVTPGAVTRGAVTPGAVTAGAVTALPTRLAIAEVRGYPGQARRAARLLHGVPGVSPAAQTMLQQALRALARHPGGGGADARITAGMPAAAAAAAVLLRLLRECEQNLDGVLRDIDTEFLHDFRVAVRRTRSAIKLLGGELPGCLAGRYAAEFKWLGDLTTPARDLDVHLLGFDETARHLVAATPRDLEPFRAFLLRRRARERRRLTAALRSARFAAIRRDWRAALLEIRDEPAPAGRGGRTAAELAVTTTARAYRTVARRGGAITAESPPQALHDLRKRCKELRYLLEFFAPLHDPAAYRTVVGDLKKLQDVLGGFQDCQVQREEIRALADAMLAERAAPAATLLAMGEVAARLAAGQVQARAAFGARFAAFAGPEGRRHMSVLLGAPHAGAPG